MRDQYNQILKDFFHDKVFHTRVEILGITQEEMADRLALSCRSYADLDHGKSSCGAVTLVLFLMYVSNDPHGFLEELHYAFDAASYQSSAAPA